MSTKTAFAVTALAAATIGASVELIAQAIVPTPEHPPSELDTGICGVVSQARSNQEPPRKGDERRG